MLNANQCLLFYSAEKTMQEHPFNAGLYSALERLAKLGVRIVDVSQMSDDQRFSEYSSSATAPSIRNKQRVRTVFGSHSRPGCNFGTGVPALVVQDADGRPKEVFPHYESGHVVTISEALTRLQ